MGFIGNYIQNLIPVLLGCQPRRPLLFSYYVTHRCNLNCIYCSDGDGVRFSEGKVEELDTKDALRLISIIAKASDTLDITGGEPLMRDDLEELMRHAKKSGLRTILNTNGIGLEERQDVIRNADVAVVSLDSLDAQKLAGIINRPEHTAKRIFSGIEYLLAKREELDVIPVLSAVAAPSNLKDVEDVMRFAVGNRMGFHVSPELNGTVVNPLLRGNAEYRALVDRIIGMKKTHKGILGVKPYLEMIRDFSCARCYPLLMAVIRPDGHMYYPCVEKKRNTAVSLLQEGSFKRALEKSSMEYGAVPECRECCHIFCHMGLSLFQRHPLYALGESKHWSI